MTWHVRLAWQARMSLARRALISPGSSARSHLWTRGCYVAPGGGAAPGSSFAGAARRIGSRVRDARRAFLATSRAMRFKTMFNGYSLAFSPFLEGRLAVTTSWYSGIIGNGQQYVLDTAPGGGLVEIARFETADLGLYDCCWSEENENILVSASGDGSVKVYDISAPPQMNPLRSLSRSTLHEAYSVHWNQVRRDVFLSASWDDTVKLWIAQRTPEFHSNLRRTRASAPTPRCGRPSTRMCSPRRAGTAPSRCGTCVSHTAR